MNNADLTIDGQQTDNQFGFRTRPIDTVASGTTGGRELFVIETAQSTATTHDISHLEIRLHPDDMLTAVASGTNATCLVGLSWLDDL